MKQILVLLLVIGWFNIFAQKQSKIYYLIDSLKKNGQKELAIKLETFAKQGIEKKLDLDSLTPDTLIKSAEYYLGTPHKMGGLDTNGIDCSGLLYMSFKNIGVSVPHSSQELGRYGKVILYPSNLKRGDLVFFVNTYKTKKVITHSGIYLGEGKFIHTSARKGVIISSLNSDYYKKHFIYGTRIFNQ